MLNKIVRAAAVCVTVFVAGCGGVGQVPDTSSPVIDRNRDYSEVNRPDSPAQPSPPRRPPVTGAAQSLMNRAELARAQGDYEKALQLLERAQRIDPHSAEIYLALAGVFEAQGDAPMAGATAERGMLYCSDVTQCDALRAFTPQ